MSASTVNITVEDTSPLIQYEPAAAWIDSPQDDPLIVQSSQGSFRTTTQPQATVSFSFKGTGIWVFGSRRPDHGQYVVRIDDGPEVFMDGSSPNPVANAPLFGASGFSMGEHTLTITNSPDDPNAAGLDIDSIVFETQASSPNTVDDSDVGSGISYLPNDAAWVPNARDFFFEGSSHFTQDQGAAFRYEFDGDAIGIYGSISQSHAAYSVELDGQKTSLTPTVSQFHQSTLLFFDSNLGPGRHTLQLTSDAPAFGPYLDLDEIQVFQVPTATSPSPSAANSRASAAPTDGDADQLPPSSSGHRFTTVEIVGIAAGALLGLCIVLVALILCLKSRRRIHSGIQSLDYPFKGIGGVMDRFKRAPAAEKGEITVAEKPFQSTPDLSWKLNAAVPPPSTSPPSIVTTLPPANPSSKPRVPPIVTDLPPAAPKPALIATNVAPGAPSRKPNAAAPKPAPRVLGPATVVPKPSPAPVVVVPSVPKAPVVLGQPKVARKAPAQITSTAAAAIGAQPQRPQLRPPPITFESDVRGPSRPTRPQTLMLSPVPVATVTFGQGQAEAI